MIKKKTSLHFCLLQFANGLLKESFARSILPIDTYLLFLIVLLTSPHYSTVVIVPFTCSLALQNTYNEFSDNDKISFKISNLFDKQYELIQDFPMPGRTFSIMFERTF